jgi:beta-1,4-mannosyltransferase
MHYSSSNLDLPMKVVDMFGCSLPVCAIAFDCLSELVKHGKNGLMFRNKKDLRNQLLTLFTKDSTAIQEMRLNVDRQFRTERWSDNWNRIVRPLLL